MKTYLAFVVCLLACCAVVLGGDESLNFAAMQGQPQIAATQPLDFRCLTPRASQLEPLDFVAMAQRCPNGQCPIPAARPAAAVTQKPVAKVQTSKPAAVPTGLRYWHTDGTWRDVPQPGLFYGQPWVTSTPRYRCVNGRCFIQ